MSYKFYRLKYTSKKGTEFLSPLVYQLNQRGLEKKMKSLAWLIPKTDNGTLLASLEATELKIGEFPFGALHKPEKKNLIDLISYAEILWERRKVKAEEQEEKKVTKRREQRVKNLLRKERIKLWQRK